MLIGVISDTHDRLEHMSQALQYFASESVDLVVHCGDWKNLSTVVAFADTAHALRLPVRGVLGNNDTDIAAFLAAAATVPGDFNLTEGVFELSLSSNTSLAAYHGHHKPTLRKVLECPDYSVILLGHSHKPKIEAVDGRLIVNPGSTAFAIPRSKTWQPSVAIVDTVALTARLHSW